MKLQKLWNASKNLQHIVYKFVKRRSSLHPQMYSSLKFAYEIYQTKEMHIQYSLFSSKK